MAMIGTLAFGAVKWWVRTSISIRLTSHSICWVRQSSQPITWLVQKPTLCGKNVRLNWTNTGQWNTGDVLSLGKVGWLVGVTALSAEKDYIVSCRNSSLLKSFVSFKKLKIYCLGTLITMQESWIWLKTKLKVYTKISSMYCVGSQ